MNIHENARLTPRGREILISRLHRGEHPADVATSMGVSPRTVYKWCRRFSSGRTVFPKAVEKPRRRQRRPQGAESIIS